MRSDKIVLLAASCAALLLLVFGWSSFSDAEPVPRATVPTPVRVPPTLPPALPPTLLLSNNLSGCKRDGFGSMFNFIRGSVYLAVTGNLTYVHHPLRATHGADVASLDRVLGLPTVCPPFSISPTDASSSYLLFLHTATKSPELDPGPTFE